MKQYDIVLVGLDPTIGAEMKKTRQILWLEHTISPGQEIIGQLELLCPCCCGEGHGRGPMVTAV